MGLHDTSMSLPWDSNGLPWQMPWECHGGASGKATAVLWDTHVSAMTVSWASVPSKLCHGGLTRGSAIKAHGSAMALSATLFLLHSTET